MSALSSVSRVFWKHAKRYPALFIFSFTLFGIGMGLQGVALPLIYKRLLDTLAMSGTSALVSAALMQVILWIVGLRLIIWALIRTAMFLNIAFESNIMADLERTAFGNLIGHSYQFFQDQFSGSLVRRVSRLSKSFEEVADNLYFKIVPLIVTFVGIQVVLFSRNTAIALAVLAWSLVFGALNASYARWKLKYDIQRAEFDSHATAVLADVIGNALTVKLFTAAEEEKKTFWKATDDLRRMRVFGWSLSEVGSAVQWIMMIGIEAVVLTLAVNAYRAHVLTIGDFVLFQSYLLSLFSMLNDLGSIVRKTYTAIADAKEMVDILELPYAVQDRKRAKALVVKNGGIVFDNVSFFYNQTRAIMEDFSLTIKPREKVALVGPSGAGKSTVVKLLLRFYDLDKGKILIDGQSIANVTQKSLHAQIALVPQEPVLFHRSLMDNIRYGKRNATDEEVKAAAEKAHCHEFISQLPDGYATLVGERGIKLSGGERQRIAIARAILKNAPILLLDEATSSLDSESEALIQQALHELMRDKTVMVIAHRLSTIMQMDRIIVLENGKITDMGTHEKLLGRAGVYQTLWNIQAGGFVGEE